MRYCKTDTPIPLPVLDLAMLCSATPKLIQCCLCAWTTRTTRTTPRAGREFFACCFLRVCNELFACCFLRVCNAISLASTDAGVYYAHLRRWWASPTSTTPRLYVAIRTPLGTGMGCNDLTSPVLQMRKYQTRQLQILAARVGLRVLDVLLLCARALPLAASLFWGVTLNHVSFEQVEKRNPDWDFDVWACDACKNRQREQVMRSRRA